MLFPVININTLVQMSSINALHVELFSLTAIRNFP